MNDFTKDELEIIKSWCISKIDTVGLVNFVGTDERELQKKIQSMITNHCDHEYAIIFSAGVGIELRCLKCEKVLNNESTN